MGGWRDESWAGMWRCMSSVEINGKKFTPNAKLCWTTVHLSLNIGFKTTPILSWREKYRNKTGYKNKSTNTWQFLRFSCLLQWNKNKITMDIKQNNTHIWIIIHSRDQVVNQGLQGPRHQVVVMIIEARVSFLFGLVQVLIVAAGVQLPCEWWRLRHVVLWVEEKDKHTSGQSGLQLLRYFTTDADSWPNKSKIAVRHKHRRQRFARELVWMQSTSFLLWILYKV